MLRALVDVIDEKSLFDVASRLDQLAFTMLLSIEPLADVDVLVLVCHDAIS